MGSGGHTCTSFNVSVRCLCLSLSCTVEFFRLRNSAVALPPTTIVPINGPSRRSLRQTVMFEVGITTNEKYKLLKI